MNEQNKELAFKDALSRSPKEACGLLCIIEGKQTYIPCQNVSVSCNEFEISVQDYAKCEDQGDIVGVVHSHVNLNNYPSQADLVSCEASGLPWYIVSVPDGAWRRIEPTGYKADIIGRVYSYGILDCYTLVRDWYLENLNIQLPTIESKWEWWKNGEDLYSLKHFESYGFRQVHEMQYGDIIVMAIRSNVGNHTGIFLGDNVMLHHAINRLSCREVYGGFWEKNTRMVLRHITK